MQAKKIVFLFPHLPNPRMIKRVKALKSSFNTKVICWDRGTKNQTKNQLPHDVDTQIIRRKANDGNPLARLGVTIKVIFDALKLIRKASPEKLYISKTDMLLVGVLYKKLFKKKVDIIYEVSDIHTLLIDVQTNIYKKIISKLLRKLEEVLCKNISLLVVTSEYFYTKYYKDFVTKSKVLFIPNTPDPKVFDGFEREKRNKFTIGFIGSVRYPKQIKMLIDVTEEFEVNVLIAGDGVSYSEIEEYSRGKRHVTLYGPYEYEKEIRSLYEKVDCIYAVYDASKKNVQIALPNRLYEAVYTDTPIICSKGTYLCEIVEKNKLGFSVGFNSKSDLYQVLTNLNKNEYKIKNLKLNTQKLRKKWSLEEYNKKLLQLINNII